MTDLPAPITPLDFHYEAAAKTEAEVAEKLRNIRCPVCDEWFCGHDQHVRRRAMIKLVG